MKSWQAILLQVGLAALTTFVGAMTSNDKGAVIGVGAGAAAASALTARQTSKHNPDGSPAEVAWDKNNKQ